MKIKYKTRAAGPDGIRIPGDIADLPEAQAKRLVAGGYAQTVDPPKGTEAEPEPKQETPKRKAGKK